METLKFNVLNFLNKSKKTTVSLIILCSRLCGLLPLQILLFSTSQRCYKSFERDLLFQMTYLIQRKKTLRQKPTLIFSSTFSKCAISCSLVIRWAYQLQILVDELNNSAEVTLLSFNTTAIFLHDVIMVSKNYHLVTRQCSWCVYVANFKLILLVYSASRVNHSQPIGSVSFVKVSFV